MFKFKKFLVAAIAAITAISAIGVCAYADEQDYSANEIDYSIYDSDMIYVQADADRVAEYNATLAQRRASYSQWNWSNGIFSSTTKVASSTYPSYYFVPTSNYLYFNVEVYDAGIYNSTADETPRLTVNILLDSGSLSYVGSYDITSSGDHSYCWSNKKRSLNAGTKYVFGLCADTSWGSSLIDIYTSAM